ncbi:DUF1493 family protein [Aestuariibacter sp. AA17]|uniref:DUF1493 family protein n=1 Tax=Fluctibacter corallii TaxID=2984329 RepID=A0ABT3AAQ8_9ALTE|nr:DUF1493 family protein [Aestuariibacter sp. AA17]MCV2885765.1 DUF1493 family protein [Aestuariibacter sp. AA17]
MSCSKLSFNDFLSDSGLDKYYKNESSLDLRLYHDLNVFGDVAESYIELLQDQYGVDISKFKFDNYFPHEYVGDNAYQRVLFWFFPFLRSQKESRVEFQGLTLRKIKDSMNSGYLI